MDESSIPADPERGVKQEGADRNLDSEIQRNHTGPQMPKIEDFVTLSDGAEDRGIPLERSETLKGLFDTIANMIHSATREATHQAMKTIIPGIPQERYDVVNNTAGELTQKIETIARDAARQGMSQALQEHPLCETCNQYYYQGGMPLHPEHDPQDRLIKCINWTCKKWYHAKCINIKYEKRDNYLCAGRYAPCNTQILSARQGTVEQGNRQVLGSLAPPLFAFQTNTTDGKMAVDSSMGPPRRVHPMKGKSKYRSDGGCGNFVTERNPAAKCDYNNCKEKKPFCTRCKENTVRPRGYWHGDRWFCTVECYRQYIASTAGDDVDMSRG